MKKSSVTEQELNVLLRQSFLNLNANESTNSRMLDSVGHYMLSVKGTITIGERGLFKRFWLSLFAICMALTTGLVILNQNIAKVEKKLPLKNQMEKSSVTKVKVESIENKTIIQAASQSDGNKKTPEKLMTSIATNAYPSPQTPTDEGRVVVLEKDSVTTRLNSQRPEASHDDYIFPVLTEKEIKANEKEKRRLTRIATRITRDKRSDVVLIPASPDGTIGSFYMCSGEVTNNEYRTFLFDLLINGRKEEFLKARPNQSLWKNVEGLSVFDSLAKVYFSDKTYNFFPVVNVSSEGAEMYCRWLVEQVDAARLKDDKIPALEIRLPYEREWMYAASSGRKDAVYPWPLAFIQNDANYFMANFCIQKLKDQMKQPIYYPHSKRPRDLSNYTSAGMMLHKPAIATIDVWSYNPNTFGLYGMSGNASEMVYVDGSKKIKTKGGNWASDFEHLKLNSGDEFEGGVVTSPKIGFRVCVFVKDQN